MRDGPAPVAVRGILRVLAVVVPRRRRGDWLEEWEAEVAALARARARGRAGDYPGWVAFVAGAAPHAMATRMEGWTMDGVLQDVRYAARVLVRAPGFTLVAALTLALGIGANASIFSLVNGLLIRSPGGIVEPERLVQIARSYDDDPRWDNWSWPALQTIRAEARRLDGVAGYQDQSFVLGRGLETEQVLGQVVTGDYFDVLGVRPYVGRLIQPDDDREPGAHPVVVLSHSLWLRRFAGDPAAVGRTVVLGAEPYEVIGVAPPGFAGPDAVAEPPALWVPTMQRSGVDGELPFDHWDWSWIQVVGRMREGVTFPEVRASLDVVSARLREASPINAGIRALAARGIGLSPDDRAEARRVSALLMLIVGVVLLLACTNVANLFLARAGTRRAEMGVRMALGAGRRRLARQLLTECLLLALLATTLALPLVLSSGRFLPFLLPYTLAVPLGPDASVFAFLVLAGALAGILFGLAPTWAVTKRGVSEALREGATTGGRGRTRLRDGLVVVQLALSLALVTGAALLGRSVLNARFAAPGFEPQGLVAGFVDPGGTGRYDDREAALALYGRLHRAASAIPGVTTATLATQLPVAGGHSRATVRPADRSDVAFEAEATVVGPDYFTTMGIPLLRGRPLGGVDDEPERVVVVNEALARMFWPGEEAVGQVLTRGDQRWRVVGLAGDVQMRSLRERGRPGVYYPMARLDPSVVAVTIRTRAGGREAVAALRRAVAEVDPQLPVARVYDLREALTASMGETRTIAWLIGAFAGLALILAGVGLYGLVSFGASQRTRELGIRLALGAHPTSLTRLLLVRGVALAAAGVGLGLALSYGLGHALSGLLFGVGAADPGTLLLACTVLLVTAVLAAWIPARRAGRADALVSLKTAP